MRCTDCIHSKETIPAQLRYVYCSKFEKEMSVTTEFENCQFEESFEYKLKEAIQNYCNNENNWIVAVDKVSLLKALYDKFNIPSFTQDIMASREFDNRVFETLYDSKKKIENTVLVTDWGDEGESREGLLILQKPQEDKKK